MAYEKDKLYLEKILGKIDVHSHKYLKKNYPDFISNLKNYGLNPKENRNLSIQIGMDYIDFKEKYNHMNRSIFFEKSFISLRNLEKLNLYK